MLIETRAMWRLPLMAVLFAFACTSRNPRSCLDDFCEDPALPFCDSDGSVSGEPGTCVAVSCEPLAFEACRGDEALVCNSTGDDFNITACPNGCDAAQGGCLACAPGSSDCAARIIPHFLPESCNAISLLPSFEILENVTVDTTDDATCTGGIIEQSNGLPICLVHGPSIKIGAGATLRVKGDRALALIADADVVIEGTLDISADLNIPGPGGSHRRSGGFSGAGFATAGGNDSMNGTGGPAVEDPALGDLLVAGATAGDSTGGAIGGGGGGAVAIIGCRGRVSVNGTIDASGGGGAGGRCFKFCGAPNQADVSGSGGGSGGYVVIQGAEVAITGQVFANGGGGGAGQQSNNVDGQAGGDGLLSAVWASNGGVAQNGGGAGGAGGHSTVPPYGGAVATAAGATAGGGGGSIGMIQIFTPANTPPSTTGATVSPDFRPHRTVETK